MAWMLIQRFRAFWYVGCCCLFLAACATPPKIAGGVAGQTFDRTGRFAVSVDDGAASPKAVQGGFAWSDNNHELQLDLANPLGSTLARIRVTPGQSLLTRADGTQERARDPDALVELVLGSPIPVAGLRDWLHGQVGGSPVRNLEKNASGQITGFEQNGWRVAASRYDAAGPRLLQMNHNEAGRRVSVRLVVDGD